MNAQAKDEIRFRMSELIEWVREFIARNDAARARLWGRQLAHCGAMLLDGVLRCDCGERAEYRIYDDNRECLGSFCAVCAVMVPGSPEPVESSTARP